MANAKLFYDDRNCSLDKRHNEAWIKFTPNGDIYGFNEILSEDLFVESLSENKALKLAKFESTEYWNVDLTNYKLVQTSQDIKPSERIDYTFVYKRNDISIGEEGEYRLKLVVSGDKLTEVKHYIKIPETFKHKYEEMRSYNNTIASVANYGILIFYVLGGIVAGLFILNRGKWLLWSTAIKSAAVVSVVYMLVQLNFLPLSWLNYDTAISTQNFMMQNIVLSILSFAIDFSIPVLKYDITIEQSSAAFSMGSSIIWILTFSIFFIF